MGFIKYLFYLLAYLTEGNSDHLGSIGAIATKGMSVIFALHSLSNMPIKLTPLLHMYT